MNALDAVRNMPVGVQSTVYIAVAIGFVGLCGALYKSVGNGCDIEMSYPDGHKVVFHTPGDDKCQ